MAKRTSTEVWNKIQVNGWLRASQLAVYGYLFHNGPCTGQEVDEGLLHQGKRGHFHKRLSELRRMGWVDVIGVRPCRITGNRVEAWDITTQEEPSAVVVYKTPLEIAREENERLQTELDAAHKMLVRIRRVCEGIEIPEIQAFVKKISWMYAPEIAEISTEEFD